MTLIRCAWAAKASPEESAYHDEEWGVPSFDDRHLFEMLILEGAQAGPMCNGTCGISPESAI